MNKCWNDLEKMKWDFIDGKKLPRGYRSTQWIHLQDALMKGTVTEKECYDAIELGYCPEYLKIRNSRYKHLLK